MTLLPGLGPPALTGLAEALVQGRLRPPYEAASVARFVAAALGREAAAALQQLDQAGLGPPQIGHLLRVLAEERRAAQQIRDRVELVWSGPEIAGSRSRDTGVVVRELFRGAKTSVLVSSYALDKGERSRGLFQPLAENMDRNEGLRVRMFINVQRFSRSKNPAPAEAVLRHFARRFREELWPGQRLPEVFYDPRALDEGWDKMACLHAKCLVVDGERVLITSANFTEAAHARNIEAGVLMTDRLAAADLRAQFEALVDQDILQPVPGMEGTS